MSVNLNNLNEFQFNEYLLNELYSKININRELYQIYKLNKDTSAEKAIETFFIENNDYNDDYNLNQNLQKEKFVSKSNKILRFNKICEDTNDRNNIIKIFSGLIESACINKQLPLMNNNSCFTHIGLNTKKISNNNNQANYIIICILSQKIISIEEIVSTKDGNIVLGSLLSSDYLIYAGKLMKNEKIGFFLGPKNIRYFNEKQKFCFILPYKDFKDLGLRKIYCYCIFNQPNLNVPYGNKDAKADTVKFDTLELGLVKVENFKEAKNFSSVNMEEFINNGGLTGELKINNNAIINNNINNNPINSTNSLKNFIQNQKNFIKNNNNNINSNNNNFMILTPAKNNSNNNNINVNSTPFFLSTIPEEKHNLNNSFISNTSFAYSPFIDKNSNNLNNNNINNNNLTNMIGARLQNAQQLKNNIKNATINTNNNNINPFNINNNDISFNGNNNTQNLNNNINNVIISNENNNKMKNNLNELNNITNILHGNNNNNMMINNNNNNLQNNTKSNILNINNNSLNNNNNANNLIYSNQNNFNINNNNLNNQNNQSIQSNNFNNINNYNNINNQLNNNNNNNYIQNQLNNNSNLNYIPQYIINNDNKNIINNSSSQLINKENQHLIIKNNPQNNNNNNYSNFLLSIQPSFSVSSYQIIPLNLKYKSLLDIKGVGTQNANEIPKIVLTNDMKYSINLLNYCSGNVQYYKINPQTKDEFYFNLLNLLENFKISFEDRNKFLNGNLNILVEENNGKLIKLNNENINIFLKLKNKREKIYNNNGKINRNMINSNIMSNSLKNNNNFYNNNNNENNNNISSIRFLKPSLTNNNNNKEFINSSNLYYNNDNNINKYSIQNYIFKNSSLKDNDNENNNNNSETIETFNEKILNQIKKKYLTPQEFSKTYNSNQSYIDLYHTKKYSDILLSIKGEIIQAHKVVLISASNTFKSLIQSNENNIINNHNITANNETIKIILPESYNLRTFKEILKWIYCGYIHENLPIEVLRDMLLMSENLQINSLQKILIIKYIIPNMSIESSILFLKDTYKRLISKECSECWTLLANFSLNCICKNSNYLIKNQKNHFLTMDIELLFKCIENSLFHLVEESHLSNLLKLIIDKGYACDIFELINKIGEKIKTCRNFDCQNINIDNVFENGKKIYNEENNINNNDNKYFNEPFETDLINSETINKIYNDNNSKINDYENKSISSFNLSDCQYSTNNILKNSNNNNIYNRMFTFGNENENDEKNSEDMNNNNILNINENNFSSLSPSTNTSPPNLDIKKNKKPSFEFKFIIENKNNNNNISIFSQIFKSNNHSWSLKLDINKIEEVSLFLIERGSNNNINLNNNNNSNFVYLNYCSILFEFFIQDKNFEKNGIIFFSFCEKQNQIIGYNNFFNLKQLSNKNYINIVIYIKEFAIHAACLQYINDNFQPIFSNKKGKCDIKENVLLYTPINKIENNNSNNNNHKKFFSYLDLNSYDITYLLYSDNLRVDNENNVISALYMYCLNKDIKNIDNMLKAVRYEFVDFKILCTLARDHDTIKNCPAFKKGFIREFKERMKKIYNNGNSNIKNNIEKKNIKRKFFSTSDTLNKLNVSNEIIKFFLEKNHHEGYIVKLNKLKEDIENEKKKNEERIKILESQVSQLTYKNNELNNENIKYKKMLKYHGKNNINNNINDNNNNNNLNNNIRGTQSAVSGIIKNYIGKNDNCIIF